MARLDFNLGAQVYCMDRAHGKLLKLVTDPQTMQVTDLIVQTGLLLRTNRVVPVSKVERAAGRGVHLAIMSEGLDRLPEYCEDEYPVPASSEMDDEQYWQERMWVAGRYSLVPPVPVGPMIQQRVHKGISPDQTVVGRGTTVRSLEGTIGKADHVLVDRASLKITHLIVNPGFFSRSRVIPISMVKGMSQEGIHVQAASKDLEQLFVFMHRDDAEILADVKGRLATLLADMAAVTIGVNKGVVQMLGVVPDEAVRRQAEEIVRSIGGVIAVENILYADTSTVLRVKSALLTDPRTRPAVDLGRIKVTSDKGTVTLEGEVRSLEVCTAATQMAARQPGVFTVVDILEIEADAQSSALSMLN